MLKDFPFFNSAGFGNGAQYQNGEYLFSSGMTKSQNGLLPFWVVGSDADSSGLTDLSSPLNFITQATGANLTGVYGTDNSGNIFQKINGVWTLVYKPFINTSGNGLIGNQKGNLMYAGSRYLGNYDGTADYTTGTIAVTNGSTAVVGTGTTFTAGMVNRRIVINGVWYTVQSFTDATHIGLTANYTGSTASGLSYAIKVGWNDQFKDFGADISPVNEWRTMDIYEEWVLIANKNQVAMYSVNDDSFNANGFNLPANFTIRTIKAGSNGILIGANIGNRCVLVLWDAFSIRSIAPWKWENGNIQAVVPYNGDTYPFNAGAWIVVTNKRLFVTNGYTSHSLTPVPDATINGIYLSNIIPQGAEIVNDKLILGISGNRTDRLRSGLLILNLLTNLWEYCPTANNIEVNNTMGAIFFDSTFTTHVSWSTQNPSKKYIGHLSNSTPSRAYLLTHPLAESNTGKVAEFVKLAIGIPTNATYNSLITFNAAVKVTNLKRQIWGYNQTNAQSPAANKLAVNGTAALAKAQVMDEVTILEGINAGQTAHITSITNPGASNETWALDTTLPNLTESGIIVQLTPFRLLSKQSISSASQLKDLLFNCRKQIQGKQYVVKIVFDSIGQTPPEFLGGNLLYNDLGEL
jgi:hypothetical protein